MIARCLLRSDRVRCYSLRAGAAQPRQIHNQLENVMKRLNAGRIWDFTAVGLSTICMLHCLGLPLLTTVLPIMTQGGENEAVHIAMLALAVPVTLWVVTSELVTHKNEFFVLFALGGLGLMLAAVMVPAFEPYETALTVLGGLTLAGAHFWRWSQHQARHVSVDEDV